MIIVSACLCGINCKYNGGNNIDERVLKLVLEGKAIPICPEQLGGLETPRLPHEISGGNGKDVLEHKAKVISREGMDSTNKFEKGAFETLAFAKKLGVTCAILKANSPSCGFGIIYDGSFSGSKKKGNGVTAELLCQNGINIFTEKDDINNLGRY